MRSSECRHESARFSKLLGAVEEKEESEDGRKGLASKGAALGLDATAGSARGSATAGGGTTISDGSMGGMIAPGGKVTRAVSFALVDANGFAEGARAAPGGRNSVEMGGGGSL